MQLLELVLQVVTLYYGGHLVINYEMTGGELVSLLLYQVSLSAAIDVSQIRCNAMMLSIILYIQTYPLCNSSQYIYLLENNIIIL